MQALDMNQTKMHQHPLKDQLDPKELQKLWLKLQLHHSSHSPIIKLQSLGKSPWVNTAGGKHLPSERSNAADLGQYSQSGPDQREQKIIC